MPEDTFNPGTDNPDADLVGSQSNETPLPPPDTEKPDPVPGSDTPGDNPGDGSDIKDNPPIPPVNTEPADLPSPPDIQTEILPPPVEITQEHYNHYMTLRSQLEELRRNLIITDFGAFINKEFGHRLLKEMVNHSYVAPSLVSQPARQAD